MARMDIPLASPSAGNLERVRLLVRILCLIGAVLCLAGLFAPEARAVIPALSPFVSLTALLASRAFGLYAGLGLAVGIITLIRPRWFCRWLCPVGLCLDGASRLGRRAKRQSRQGSSWGRWLVILTLGGALAGCPLFLWLDPLALFSGLVHAPAEARRLAGWASAAVLLTVGIACLFWPHLWCHRVCPLGAFQDLLGKAARRVYAWFCPRRRWNVETNSSIIVGRRTVLGFVLGFGCVKAARLSSGAPAKPLRPPGAVDEGTFVGLCLRCGNCIGACPYGIVQPDANWRRWSGLCTPALDFTKEYCREDCVRCTSVCPSGALVALSPAQKKTVRIGRVRVDMDLCLLGRDQECSACRRWCPYDAIRYEFSESRYTLTCVIDPARCNGCGACQMACPTAPVKAIQVVPLS